MTNINREGLATEVNRDQLVAELRRLFNRQPATRQWLLLDAATLIETQGREIERYRTTLQAIADDDEGRGYVIAAGTKDSHQGLALAALQSPTQAPLQEGATT